MFVFYFGIFANITPPVALAAFAGAGISGGDPMRTGFTALKLSAAGFLIPYLFVYNPAMMMIDITGVATNAKEFPMAAITDIIMITTTAVIGIIALSAAIEGYFKTYLNPFLRIILAAGALLMIIPETYTDIAGVIIVAVMFTSNWMKSKKEEQILSVTQI